MAARSKPTADRRPTDGLPRWFDRRAIREIAGRQDRYRPLDEQISATGTRRIGRRFLTLRLPDPPA